MRTFLKRLYSLVEHPKTSAAGLAGSIGCIYTWVRHPEKLTEVPEWTVFFVSLGLLFGADAKKKVVKTSLKSKEKKK